jgi:hypothetical protein
MANATCRRLSPTTRGGGSYRDRSLMVHLATTVEDMGRALNARAHMLKAARRAARVKAAIANATAAAHTQWPGDSSGRTGNVRKPSDAVTQ